MLSKNLIAPTEETPDSVSNILRETFLEIRSKHGRYSMRAFAKKLSLSHSSLSQIFAGKRKLSFDRALEIIQKLELSEEKREKLLMLAQIESARSSVTKIALSEQYHSKFDALVVEQLTLDHFSLIAEWYGLPLLELVSTYGQTWSSLELAHHLGIESFEVENMIQKLIRLELIEKERGRYRRLTHRIHIDAAVSNDALRKFYLGCIEKMRASIEGQSPQEKDIRTNVIAFDPKDLPEAKKLTAKYHQDLLKLAQKGKKRKALYQVFTNFYRMNREK